MAFWEGKATHHLTTDCLPMGYVAFPIYVIMNSHRISVNIVSSWNIGNSYNRGKVGGKELILIKVCKLPQIFFLWY
jgi:hypothetical protein